MSMPIGGHHPAKPSPGYGRLVEVELRRQVETYLEDPFLLLNQQCPAAAVSQAIQLKG
ncbi:hypothetical protein PCANC_14874 [Puccinia coronata f. sp. avenae]|uniref:Uncharacterized protein n=1 Tax=Puccinia coronata f. sp. avenae TaxID=200324 RepID=A0A2N5UNS2_9BASI|nr:hypothetical protein PCANC_14874 [Puccinia coronata f. sp. avenae]